MAEGCGHISALLQQLLPNIKLVLSVFPTFACNEELLHVPFLHGRISEQGLTPNL